MWPTAAGNASESRPNAVPPVPAERPAARAPAYGGRLFSFSRTSARRRRMMPPRVWPWPHMRWPSVDRFVTSGGGDGRQAHQLADLVQQVQAILRRVRGHHHRGRLARQRTRRHRQTGNQRQQQARSAVGGARGSHHAGICRTRRLSARCCPGDKRVNHGRARPPPGRSASPQGPVRRRPAAAFRRAVAPPPAPAPGRVRSPACCAPTRRGRTARSPASVFRGNARALVDHRHLGARRHRRRMQPDRAAVRARISPHCPADWPPPAGSAAGRR